MPGGHICGTHQQFLDGGTYDPSLPPNQYSPTGLPLCCNPVKVGGGGAGAGGKARVSIIPPVKVSGGAGASGYSPAGLATEDTPTGGLKVGGPVTEILATEDTPTGGLKVGGPVTEILATADTPAGGLKVGGPVTEILATEDTPTGGLKVGGPVTENYTPGQPTPGASCAAAPSITLGQNYSYSLSGMFTENWFKFVVPSSGTMHVTTTGTGISLALTVYETGTCPSPNYVIYSVSGPPTWEWVATAGDTVWVEFTNFGGGTYPYTFVVGTGP